MADVVYALCAAMSAVCAALLLRAYRTSRAPMLLWTSLCFLGLLVNNLLLVVDKTILSQRDLSALRAWTLAASGAVLLLGLIWEAR